MEFLSRISTVKNSTAFITVFFAWYISASLTVVLMQNQFEDTMRSSALILLCVIVFMTLMFLLSRVFRRMDVVDAGWGPAFVVAAVSSFLLNGHELEIGANTQTLVVALVIIWATRLSYTITKRLLKKPEDVRYVNLRKAWKGNIVLNTFVRIFMVQALLATIVSSAVIHINLSMPADIGVYAMIGATVWLIGFAFEAIADFQLRRHVTDPRNKGKLMTSGLWRYTRHPNYFGEATMWWGIFIIALQTPFGWLGIVTPVVITFLLLFVSGVPMTEKAFEGRSGWKAYRARTSKFVPLLPKND